jgi:hypothetical protein
LKDRWKNLKRDSRQTERTLENILFQWKEKMSG